jgi:hypothetical protein
MISDAADIHDDLRGQRFGEGSAQVVDHAGTGNRPRRSRARKNPVLALLAMILAALCSRAAADDTWFLVPEPKFMGHQITQPIPGSKNTVLAAAHLTGFGVEFARREEWQKLAIDEATLSGATRKQTAEWLKQLKPEFIRDKKKVVQYGRIVSESVPVAAVVLSPDFWQQFSEVFGPKMRVVIPNRQTLFIFPDLDGNLDRHARMVIEAWRSRWPKVSLEMFEVSEHGLRAVGAFEEP